MLNERMHFAVIKTGGKQYLVEKGKKIRVEKIDGKEGASITLHEVLATFDREGKSLNLGFPKVSAKVTAKIVRQGKADKVTIIKYKNKVRYRRSRGHRQPFTEIEITGVA